MCIDKNDLGKPVFSSSNVEVFYDDLKKKTPPPEWMKDILFNEDTEKNKKDEQTNQSA